MNMKRLMTGLLPLLLSCTAMASDLVGHVPGVPTEIAPIKAPFAMPQLARPTFPERTRIIESVGEGLATAAIQRAIDEVSAEGGGRVVVPAGRWLTGRLTLKSGVNLVVDEGATLEFSGNVADYQPAVLTRSEGVDLYSLGAMVYAYGATDIALTGKGTILSPDVGCELWRQQDKGISPDLEKTPLAERVYDGKDGSVVFLPTMFGPIACTNVLVEGLTFKRSIYWNLAPTYCKNTIIRDCAVYSHGHGRTDGIDIDSSVDTLIEYVTLDCGDDCFTLKSGRGNDGVDRALPTVNVVIRHCRGIRGAGGVAIGSETAAMVRNVYATDCTFERVNFPILMKSRRPRGGGGENLTFEDVRIGSCKTAVNIDMLGSKRWVGDLANRYPARPVGKLTPRFERITVKDVTVENCDALFIARGLPEQPVQKLSFENIVSTNRIMKMEDVASVSFK